MCGRARCSLAHEEVASTSGVDQSKWRDADKYTPKYNMSPGSKAPVIRKDKEVWSSQGTFVRTHGG